MNISERLKALRSESNLTQRELATRINVSRSAINNYENQGVTPGLDVIVSLAKFYNVTVDYLLGIETVDVSREITKELRLMFVSMEKIIQLLNKKR